MVAERRPTYWEWRVELEIQQAGGHTEIGRSSAVKPGGRDGHVSFDHRQIDQRP